ncbi:MAG: hypothetical protein GF383_11915 [Candidatus Lokiarchaeota archaeon]|nr:hypothetical protein [Candidatus Lokiarchaeota archaeon]MBD3341580.1 hypothetical protein [Candidatus Lokiarchaeota archaeon]
MELYNFKKKMPRIFERVRKDVKRVTGRHRAGLSLGLAEMGMFQGGFIGGMHFPPGTDIVMNITPLKIILERQSYEVIWSYTYHILLHEYIHSLGVWDEQQCRAITLKISEEIFEEENHPAIILAKNGIGAYFPNLNIIYAPPEYRPDGIPIEYVSGFDSHSYSYYS